VAYGAAVSGAGAVVEPSPPLQVIETPSTSARGLHDLGLVTERKGKRQKHQHRHPHRAVAGCTVYSSIGLADQNEPTRGPQRHKTAVGDKLPKTGILMELIGPG
jgi:hypothetical protein